MIHRSLRFSSISRRLCLLLLLVARLNAIEDHCEKVAELSVYDSSDVEASLQVLDSLVHRVGHRAHLEPSLDFLEEGEDGKIADLKELRERNSVSLDDIRANRCHEFVARSP